MKNSNNIKCVQLIEVFYGWNMKHVLDFHSDRIDISFGFCWIGTTSTKIHRHICDWSLAVPWGRHDHMLSLSQVRRTSLKLLAHKIRNSWSEIKLRAGRSKVCPSFHRPSFKTCLLLSKNILVFIQINKFKPHRHDVE